jgi:hypothetical protein
MAYAPSIGGRKLARQMRRGGKLKLKEEKKNREIKR